MCRVSIGNKKKSFAHFASFAAKKIKFEAAFLAWSRLFQISRGAAEARRIRDRFNQKLRVSASPRETKNTRFRFGTCLEWQKADFLRFPPLQNSFCVLK